MAGWVLGQAGLKTKTRKGLAALILGANMPDIDVFFGNAPWDPLAIHRGFTHGLVGGVLVMSPVLAGLLWLLDRWHLRSGKPFKSGLEMHFGWLVALSYLGAITHPLLDLLTTYSVQLLSPFSSIWYHADGLFIIDVWIWAGLGLTIAISRWKERSSKEWRRLPQRAIVLVLVYIGANLLISQRANSLVRNADPSAQSIFASPPPVLSWKRDLVWLNAGCYRRGHYDPLAGFSAGNECQPTNMDDPLVREAIRRDRRLQKFLKWSVMPQADVKRSRCAINVAIGDARYGQRRSSRLARETILPTGVAGCSTTRN